MILIRLVSEVIESSDAVLIVLSIFVQHPFKQSLLRKLLCMSKITRRKDERDKWFKA